MTRTKQDAQSLASIWGFTLGQSFHSLHSDAVQRITQAADVWKYRKPANANGSRTRYFYEYLNRLADKEED